MKLSRLLNLAVLTFFISFAVIGASHAAVTVDGPYIDTATQGDWRGKYDIGGSCFYLLPQPAEKYIEYDINLNGDAVCAGGSFLTSGNLQWDLFAFPNLPMYAWYFDPNDPLVETRPASDGTHPADQWNPCLQKFWGATFDNGDLDPSRGIFEPLVSEVTVNFTGSFRIAYYFLEELANCGDLKYDFWVNGNLEKTGTIADFDTGKYVVFNISGLEGNAIIRLEVTNPYGSIVYPGGVVLSPNCGADQNARTNSHLSGILIDKCYGCTASLGDYVWNDANKNGIQDATEMPLAGVVVTLTKPDGTKMTATTNDMGYYQFSNLCPGTYKVEVGTPMGYTPTTCNNSDNAWDPTIAANQTDSNCSGVMVPLAHNTSNQTIDFGFYKMMMCPGTGTPGYWKNHPEAWPVDSITIGGVTYTKAKAIALMGCSDSGNKLFTMFRALVAAKLNAIRGCGGTCIDGTIAEADAWMAMYAPGGMPTTCGGTPVIVASSPAWKVGEKLYYKLDKYNNGQLYVDGILCAPSRDYTGDPHPTQCAPITYNTGGGGKKK